MEIGLIGYGYWGTNILRNLLDISGEKPVHVAELREERREALRPFSPKVRVYQDASQLLMHDSVRAIVIATPTSSHFALAKAALQHGKHVLVEKPLTDNVREAEELIALAKEKGLQLMVDHIYLYNGAVDKLKELLRHPSFGDLQYIDATRINLGIYQGDVNVMLDLATHDLSIILEILQEAPTHVRTIGKYNPFHGREDLAYLFLKFPSGLLVEIKSSWASPVKIRQIIFGGSKQMVIYDDVEPTHKIKIYKYEAMNGDDEMRNKALVDYRLGDISIPKFSAHEPLKAALFDFKQAIEQGRNPYSHAEKALPVIRILEHAMQSLREDGNWVAL
jgi:predicted dehydrogenase